MTVNNAGHLETRLKNVIWSLVSGLFFTAVDEVPTQAPDFAAFPVNRARGSQSRHNLSGVKSFPYERKGDRLRWMR